MSPLRVRIAALAAIAVAGLAWACDSVHTGQVPRPARASETTSDEPLFGDVAPETLGVDSDGLVSLAEWVKTRNAPIFSVLVSRHGHLVFELYTSHIQRDDAHYVMSVTKTVTSALVGLAIDAHLLPAATTPVSELLPERLFTDPGARARFEAVTLKDVLGMSALDAQVPPHLVTPETKARERAFLAADNRAAFGLTQAVLPAPGVSFQYTDITPLLATGALSYATKTTALEFADEHLFGPLGFRNAEWMHEDAAGIDNGAYGLRLRPVDMQKLGILFLGGGVYEGRRILSDDWVHTSFSPWIRTSPEQKDPNYGWYWWQVRYGPWLAHVANGWKGQRIVVVPEEGVVVTTTGAMDAHEDAVIAEVMRLVIAATRPDASGPIPENPNGRARLAAKLREVHEAERIPVDVESRLIPQALPKERHHRFRG